MRPMSVSDLINNIRNKGNKIVYTGEPSTGIRDTLVTVKDLDTGKVLDQGSNSILYAGSLNSALADFHYYSNEITYLNDDQKYIYPENIAIPPNYDISLLGKSVYSDGTLNSYTSDGVACLFAVGIDGVENSVQSSQKKVVQYEGYMNPNDMCAFRVVSLDNDLNNEEKAMYGAVKQIGSTKFYYFKKFDSTPIIKTIRTKSGQMIDLPGSNSLASAEAAKKYYNDYLITYQENSQVLVQMSCIVTPKEIREWFEYKGQPNNTNVSSIMICTAIPIYDEEGNFIEYRNIMPKSKRHITRELLLEAEKGLEIVYQYMY